MYSHIFCLKNQECETVVHGELFSLRIILVRSLCNFFANQNWILLSGLHCVGRKVWAAQQVVYFCCGCVWVCNVTNTLSAKCFSPPPHFYILCTRDLVVLKIQISLSLMWFLSVLLRFCVYKAVPFYIAVVIDMVLFCAVLK